MRKISDLTIDDFPGVDVKKFSDWKEAEQTARTNAWIMLMVMVGTGIISIPLIGGFIGYILPLVTYFTYAVLVGMPNGKKARGLARELGITRHAIKEAQRRETSASNKAA